MLFVLGIEATRKGHFLIAISALNKLESLAEIKGDARQTTALHNLLGLIAHLWKHGESARKLAMQSLSRTTSCFTEPLGVVLVAATEYHFSIGNFDVADRLLEMRHEFTATELGFVQK